MRRVGQGSSACWPTSGTLGASRQRRRAEARPRRAQVRPLRRQLTGLRAWITGQRKDQSPGTRAAVPVVQVDPAFQGADGGPGSLVKLNPLSNVSSAEVWNFLRIMARAPCGRRAARAGLAAAARRIGASAASLCLSLPRGPACAGVSWRCSAAHIRPGGVVRACA